MKQFLIAGLAIVAIFIVFIGGVFLYFYNFDYIGYKDPKTVRENVANFKKELLRARFVNVNEVCEITLSDSTNIRLLIGNNKVDALIFREYAIDGDTIIIKDNKEDNEQENAQIVKMIPSKKMLLEGNRLLFDYNLKDKKFNPSRFMQIEMNVLN